MMTLGQALAGSIIGMTLNIFKYIPNVVNQTDTSLFGIRLLMGPIPAFFLIMGGIIVLFYPITKKEYEKLIK